MGRLWASGCAALGGVVMAVGGLSTAWWSAPLGLDVGLRGARVCVGEHCESATLAQVWFREHGFASGVGHWVCCWPGAALVKALRPLAP